MNIEHNKPTIAEEDVLAVTEVLQSGYIAQGNKVAEMEALLSKYSEIPFSVAVSNGTTAIYLALYACDIGEGDEVIIPTYVCSALLNAIFMLKAKPVLVDVNETDFNISWHDVSNRISVKTRAIIVPHIHGMPSQIANDLPSNIVIIEDCATALGSYIENKHVGNRGFLSIFSFYATKYATSGQGGFVCSHYRQLIEKVMDYRNFDCCNCYIPRFNFQMTDLQAALGISQLKRIQMFSDRRKQIAIKYQQICDKYNVDYQKPSADSISYNNYRFIIKLEQIRRNMVMSSLRQKGIDCIVPIEDYELLHNYLHLPKTDFLTAEKLAATTLSLPIYPSLNDEQIDYILMNLKQYLS